MRDGVTATGNQRHQLRDLMPERVGCIIGGFRSQGWEGETKNRECWEGGGMMRESPPESCGGETEIGRELGCRKGSVEEIIYIQ